MDSKCILQNPIPNMWKLVFAKVPVLGVINPDERCFLYSPSDALGLPTHYGETVQSDEVTCSVAMVINWEGGPKMFLLSVPKGPTSFTDVLHHASWIVTLISVDNTSFVGDVILVLWGY